MESPNVSRVTFGSSVWPEEGSQAREPAINTRPIPNKRYSALRKSDLDTCASRAVAHVVRPQRPSESPVASAMKRQQGQTRHEDNDLETVIGRWLVLTFRVLRT